MPFDRFRRRRYVPAQEVAETTIVEPAEPEVVEVETATTKKPASTDTSTSTKRTTTKAKAKADETAKADTPKE